MRVTNNHNTYTQHRPRSKSKSAGFGEILTEMSTTKSQENEKKANLDKWTSNMQKVNPHQDHGTQIKLPSKELLIANRQPNAESVGDKELTGSQILSLQSDYDVENLTSEMRRSLLCDLTDMGVLSATDLSSDDQSKVDGVLENIKAFKMGVLTYVEQPEQPEVIISDGSDPELRGLSDEEKFAAIMKKYEGGTTSYKFSQMASALANDKLITREESHFLGALSWNDYNNRRYTTEQVQGSSFNVDLFNKNYRVTMDNLLKESTKFDNYNIITGQPYKVEEGFMKEFAAKFEAISKTL